LELSVALISCYIEYVQRFATKEAADAADGQDEADEDDAMSDMGAISDDDADMDL
jgi:ubiquitin-conjugating enzyme E2 H